MINKFDVEMLTAELEEVRAQFVGRRLEDQAVNQLKDKAADMLEKSRGGKFEASIQSVNDLLVVFEQGLARQKMIEGLRRAA